jgi:hypothetical protein
VAGSGTSTVLAERISDRTSERGLVRRSVECAGGPSFGPVGIWLGGLGNWSSAAPGDQAIEELVLVLVLADCGTSRDARGAIKWRGSSPSAARLRFCNIIWNFSALPGEDNPETSEAPESECTEALDGGRTVGANAGRLYDVEEERADAAEDLEDTRTCWRT